MSERRLGQVLGHTSPSSKLCLYCSQIVPARYMRRVYVGGLIDRRLEARPHLSNGRPCPGGVKDENPEGRTA